MDDEVQVISPSEDSQSSEMVVRRSNYHLGHSIPELMAQPRSRWIFKGPDLGRHCR